MKLSSVLNRDVIFYDIHGHDAESVYTDLLERLLEKRQIPGTAAAMVTGMIEREDATGITYDRIAYPHLRLAGYDDLGIAIGFLQHPVKLRKTDLGESRMIIMSVVGEKVADFYLKTLAACLKYFSPPGRVEAAVGAGSPEALHALLDRDGVVLKKTLTAEDLMDRSCEAITSDKTLREAFDQFTRTRLSVLPVVDDRNRLIGILDAVDIISKFVPEYLLMLPSSQFIESFETFDTLNREEGTRMVREFMRPPKLMITPDTPLIRCTIEICRHTLYTIFVTEPDGTLVGEFSVKNIIHRVLRG